MFSKLMLLGSNSSEFTGKPIEKPIFYQFENTFLGLPPQWNLDENTHERFGVPILFAFMHGALYNLAWIPIPFWRGFWRYVSESYPNTQHVVPVNEWDYFHRLSGIYDDI